MIVSLLSSYLVEMMQTCYNANSKFGKHFRFFKTVCQPRFATEPEKVLNRGRGGPGERGSGRYDNHCWLPYLPPGGLLWASVGRHFFWLVNKLYMHTTGGGI